MHDDRAVRVVPGVLHAERRENALLHELLVAAAADFLDHVSEQDVPGIAVAHFLAGKEVERLVADRRDCLQNRRVHHPPRFFFGPPPEVWKPPSVREQIEERGPGPRPAALPQRTTY